MNAIVLPEGFETVNDYDIEDLKEKDISLKDNTPFCRENYASILSYITYISPTALKEIYNYTSDAHFGKKYSMTVGYSYYRSACSFCQASQGDNFVISEFNSPFFPIKIEEYSKIQLYKIQKKILLCAGGNSLGYPKIDGII